MKTFLKRGANARGAIFVLAIFVSVVFFSKSAISSRSESPPKIMDQVATANPLPPVSDFDPAERISLVAERVSPAVVSIKAERGKPNRALPAKGDDREIFPRKEPPSAIFLANSLNNSVNVAKRAGRTGDRRRAVVPVLSSINAVTL